VRREGCSIRGEVFLQERHEQITSCDAEPDGWREKGVPEHLVEMAGAALRLSERAGLRPIARWVHMLGFRGHFVTKSRGFSTTLGELRAARAAYRAERDEPAGPDEDSTLVVAAWEYIGSGYLNPGDVLLAAGVEASIRTGREALRDARRLQERLLVPPARQLDDQPRCS
jgi:hypothetical protein